MTGMTLIQNSEKMKAELKQEIVIYREQPSGKLQ